METYLQPWKRFADFGGRASRKEFWVFWGVNYLLMSVFALLIAMVGALAGDPGPRHEMSTAQGVALAAFGVFILALIIPGWALAVRRLHDSGRSGWWLLIGLVYIVGGLVLLVFYLLEGDKGDNDYGADPYGGRNSSFISIAPPPPGAYTDLGA